MLPTLAPTHEASDASRGEGTEGGLRRPSRGHALATRHAVMINARAVR
jgi:hypothetical protein